MSSTEPVPTSKAPDTMEGYTDEERKLARDIQEGSQEKPGASRTFEWAKRNKGKSALALFALNIVGGLVWRGGEALINNTPDTPVPIAGTATAEAEALDADTVIEANKDLRQPYVYPDQQPYEKIVQPATLNAEDVAAWESGDPDLRSDVAFDNMSQRFATAMFQVQDADEKGLIADISYFSEDPAVYEDLQKLYVLANELSPDEPVDDYTVCRPNNPTPVGLCDPNANYSLETNEPVESVFGTQSDDVYVTVKANEENSADAVYNTTYVTALRPDFHYELAGDTLKAVSNN